MIDGKPRIGDEVYIHGYIDEIRNDVVIIRNEGGYFGTVPSEVFCYEEDRNGYGTMNSADTPQTDCEACELDGKADVCKICRVSNYEPQTDCGWK